MNVKMIAILGVLGVALYLIFGNKVAGSTVFTGSTAQPTPLSTAGGIGSLEGALAGLFGAVNTSTGGAPASQGTGGTVVTAANSAQYPNVPIGSTIGGSTDTQYLGGDSLAQFYSSGIGTESVENPSLIPTTNNSGLPVAPQVTTNVNAPSLAFLGSSSTGGTSLDATNLSIGAIPPPGASVIDPSTSLDSSGFDFSGLSSLG
jgi:hypothetical protein